MARRIEVVRLTSADQEREHQAGIRAGRSWLHRRRTEDLAVILNSSRGSMKDDELKWVAALSASIVKQVGSRGSFSFWRAFWGVLEAEYLCR